MLQPSQNFLPQKFTTLIEIVQLHTFRSFTQQKLELWVRCVLNLVKFESDNNEILIFRIIYVAILPLEINIKKNNQFIYFIYIKQIKISYIEFQIISLSRSDFKILNTQDKINFYFCYLFQFSQYVTKNYYNVFLQNSKSLNKKIKIFQQKIDLDFFINKKKMCT